MKKTILIVDDQREIIRMLKSGLESLGRDLVVKGALSGEEALLETRLGQVDLLVTDIRLPGMSGLELMAHIRRDNPGLAVILLTGATDVQIRQSASQAGAEAFFLKPVPVGTFLDTVENILDLSLPLEGTPPAADREPPEDTRISQRLADLHRELGGLAVILINERGEQVVKAGDLPEEDSEPSWLPAIMAAFSAGQRIGFLLGNTTPHNLQIFHGARYDLVLTTVGSAYALLVATTEPMVGERAGRVSARIQAALEDITGMLEQIGVPVWEEDSTPVSLTVSDLAEIPPAGQQEMDRELEALLESQPDELFEEQNPDDFWEPEDDSSGSGSLNADALSYEQARQLGLAPDDED